MQLLHSTGGTSGSSFHGADTPPSRNCWDELFAVLDLLVPLVLTPHSHQNHHHGLECHENMCLFNYIHNGCWLCICCELLPYAWAHTYAHTCAHTHRCSHTACACLHAHTYACIPYIQTCAPIHVHTHSCPHTHICTPMHPYLCAHAPAHTRALAHTAHVHTHAEALAPRPGAMTRKKEI